MTDPFATPGTAGSGISWNDHKGALVVVDVQSLESGIKTSYGDTDAVRADIDVIDGPGAGESYPDSLVFPKVLQSQLRSRVGQKVLGRVTQGVAKPGQSAPWMLDDPSEADKALGVQHLAGKLSTAAAPPF